MFTIIKLLEETSNPKRVCSGTLERLNCNIRYMREDNGGKKLTSEQLDELRAIVSEDLADHQAMHGIGRIER